LECVLKERTISAFLLQKIQVQLNVLLAVSLFFVRFCKSENCFKNPTPHFFQCSWKYKELCFLLSFITKTYKIL